MSAWNLSGERIQVATPIDSVTIVNRTPESLNRRYQSE